MEAALSHGLIISFGPPTAIGGGLRRRRSQASQNRCLPAGPESATFDFLPALNSGEEAAGEIIRRRSSDAIASWRASPRSCTPHVCNFPLRSADIGSVRHFSASSSNVNFDSSFGIEYGENNTSADEIRLECQAHLEEKQTKVRGGWVKIRFIYFGIIVLWMIISLMNFPENKCTKM